MSLDLKAITVDQFCDLQGVADADRQTLNKVYAEAQKPYEEWHEIVSAEFELSEIKYFTQIKSK